MSNQWDRRCASKQKISGSTYIILVKKINDHVTDAIEF